MSGENGVDLELLETAIVTDLRAKFPDLQAVEFYREERTELPTPAVLLELTEWEYDEDNDPGTEQLSIIAHFEAEVIIGFRKVQSRKAKAEIRRLVGAMAASMHNNRWNDPARPGKKIQSGPVQIVGAYPDDFQGMDAGERGKGLDRFVVWRLAWQQRVELGKSVWTNDGTIPTEILYSFTPDVGIPHKDEYLPLDQVFKNND